MESGGCDTTTIRRLTQSCAFRNSLVLLVQNPRGRGNDVPKRTAGARINAKKVGLNIVYDKSYPPATTDFGPVVRAIQSADADIVYNASYPLDTVGIVRAAHEAGLKTKMFGGNMIGLLAAVFKKQLGPLLNGVVSTADTFVPAPSFDFPGIKEVLKKYQEAPCAKTPIRSDTSTHPMAMRRCNCLPRP